MEKMKKKKKAQNLTDYRNYIKLIYRFSQG